MNANRKRSKIERILEGGLTAAQLIKVLTDMPPDAVVVFGCDYGDIGHTEQALVVRKAEELEHDEERLARSDYSNSGLEIESFEDEDAEPSESEQGMIAEPCNIVILRS